MAKKFTPYLFLFFVNSIFGQSTDTTTIYYTGFQACGGCTVCGADYWCFNTPASYCGDTPPCDTTTFFDSVPAGNIVTNIQVQYWSAECSGGYLSATINGDTVPTVYEGNTGCMCDTIPCAMSASSTVNYPLGMPSYVYGGWNTLQLCTGDDVCINRIILVFTYMPLGINEIVDNNSFLIYPNPTNGMFTIQLATGNWQLASSQKPEASIEVYNVYGEKVYEENLQSAKGGSKQINLSLSSDIEQGIYFFQIQTEQGIAVKKLIVN